MTSVEMDKLNDGALPDSFQLFRDSNLSVFLSCACIPYVFLSFFYYCVYVGRNIFYLIGQSCLGSKGSISSGTIPLNLPSLKDSSEFTVSTSLPSIYPQSTKIQILASISTTPLKLLFLGCQDFHIIHVHGHKE